MGQLNDMQQYLVDEFVEDYQEGHLSRREALRRIAAITGSLVMATTIMAACGPANDPATASTQATAAPAGATSAAGAAATTAPTDVATEAVATSTPAAEAAATSVLTTTETAATATAGAQATAGSAGAAPNVAADDPAVRAEDVQFPGEGATIMGYLARPSSGGPFPILLVCHENRGLTEHIKDVTRRAAKAGYVALAVDLLSRQGGSAAVGEADVPGALGQSPPEQFVQDFRSGLTFVQGQPDALKDRVGMFGFCFGGGVTWRAATQIPELRAAVPFYGPHPPVADVPKIQAAVLAIYGENDQRINAGIPEIEAAMQQNGKTFQKQIYAGAGHAFHNDTGRNYNADAARDAWAKTLAWFEQYVKG